jgi:hypothetical protein
MGKVLTMWTLARKKTAARMEQHMVDVTSKMSSLQKGCHCSKRSSLLKKNDSGPEEKDAEVIEIKMAFTEDDDDRRFQNLHCKLLHVWTVVKSLPVWKSERPKAPATKIRLQRRGKWKWIFRLRVLRTDDCIETPSSSSSGNWGIMEKQEAISAWSHKSYFPQKGAPQLWENAKVHISEI